MAISGRQACIEMVAGNHLVHLMDTSQLPRVFPFSHLLAPSSPNTLFLIESTDRKGVATLRKNTPSSFVIYKSGKRIRSWLDRKRKAITQVGEQIRPWGWLFARNYYF